jgi:hypothetical protein
MLIVEWDWQMCCAGHDSVARKSISHHLHHLAWQRTERQWVEGDTGLMDMAWAMAGVPKYIGSRDSQGSWEYIFGRPWGR